MMHRALDRREIFDGFSVGFGSDWKNVRDCRAGGGAASGVASASATDLGVSSPSS